MVEREYGDHQSFCSSEWSNDGDLVPVLMRGTLHMWLGN